MSFFFLTTVKFRRERSFSSKRRSITKDDIGLPYQYPSSSPPSSGIVGIVIIPDRASGTKRRCGHMPQAGGY